ncbi:BcsR/BcsP family cellulose biosynthesis protein [Castellaniella caeni]|uniref:BcsR/BcsP family cellulose biosynthesis protein n=1 Tax=Castellaniella caeni TaxID=266123 RepID=UPI00082C8150|nr:BcsR/BcsP family cellulose biosynthesis protein [Castellaniella caeni]
MAHPTVSQPPGDDPQDDQNQSGRVTSLPVPPGASAAGGLDAAARQALQDALDRWPLLAEMDRVLQERQRAQAAVEAASRALP